LPCTGGKICCRRGSGWPFRARSIRTPSARLRPGAYVVVARAPAAQADGAALRAAFERGLHKLGALPQAVVLGTMPPAGLSGPPSLANAATSS